MHHYSIFRRLENELIANARARGYQGTPFRRDPAPLGTLDQELEAISLSLSISPRPETPGLRAMVRRWARNVVMSSQPPQLRTG